MPKIPRAENFPRRNVLVLKSPSAGTSAAPNGAHAEMFPWWNIRAEMTLAEMFSAEMVYSRELQWAQEVKSNYEIIKKLINFYVTS